jgi:hypothetical protein
MSFADFEHQMIKENRKLKILFIASFFISIAIFAMLLTQKSYFIYKGGEVFEERLLTTKICEEGFLSITQGEPNPHFVTKGIIKLLQSADFKVSVDKILKLQSLEHGACKVIVLSEEKLLAFKVALTQSNLYPFDYKLNQIDELPIKEEDRDLSYNR